MEENHSYSEVVGNSAMPYLNGLVQQGAVAAAYYANSHPSIGNYFELTAGAIITTDDNFAGTVAGDNLAREFAAAGKTWKVYAESLPQAGYMGGDVYPYSKHHNPFVYFTDVLNSSAQQQNVVSFSQFAADWQGAGLPNFSFVIPNLNDDAHDCPAGASTCLDNDKLAAADQWLQQNIAPLLSNARFQSDGLLLIVFDEGDQIDFIGGGGHTFLLAAGPGVKKKFASQVFYQHQNTLRTVCNIFGLAACPGDGANAAPLNDLFQ